MPPTSAAQSMPQADARSIPSGAATHPSSLRWHFSAIGFSLPVVDLIGDVVALVCRPPSAEYSAWIDRKTIGMSTNSFPEDGQCGAFATINDGFLRIGSDLLRAAPEKDFYSNAWRIYRAVLSTIHLPSAAFHTLRYPA